MVTILCIDDDPKMLQVHKAVLSTKGYTVMTAPDGPTGIAMARMHSIDVVITDFQMPPGMDGSEVARLLMLEKPMLPVVIYSGCLEDIPKRMKCFLMSKGDDPDRLLSMIDALVAITCTEKKHSAPKKSRSLRHKKAI
jgi:CheY-like chemotaxis protein